MFKPLWNFEEKLPGDKATFWFFDYFLDFSGTFSRTSWFPWSFSFLIFYLFIVYFRGGLGSGCSLGAPHYDALESGKSWLISSMILGLDETTCDILDLKSCHKRNRWKPDIHESYWRKVVHEKIDFLGDSFISWKSKKRPTILDVQLNLKTIPLHVKILGSYISYEILFLS